MKALLSIGVYLSLILVLGMALTWIASRVPVENDCMDDEG